MKQHIFKGLNPFFKKQGVKCKEGETLYSLELTLEIYNSGNEHDYDELTRSNNLSFFFLPLFSSWLGLDWVVIDFMMD